MGLDPRRFAAVKRVSMFKHVVPVLSPKGGVGKTTVAVALSLALSEGFGGAALLDLDVGNPTAHIVLGLSVDRVAFEEDMGLKPLKLLDGMLEFMSVALFTKGRLLPLRGAEASSTVVELLTITRWGKSVLVVDTPPGFSDEVMEFLRLCPRATPVIVSSPDRMAIASAKGVLEVLASEGIRVLGVVGNMCRGFQDQLALRKSFEPLGVEVLTCVPWIDGLHDLYGDLVRLKSLLSPHLLPVLRRLCGDGFG